MTHPIMNKQLEMRDKFKRIHLINTEENFYSSTDLWIIHEGLRRALAIPLYSITSKIDRELKNE